MALKVARNKMKMRATYFGRPRLYKNHSRNGNTLCYLHSVLSVNAGGYTFIKKQEVRAFLPGYGQDTREIIS